MIQDTVAFKEAAKANSKLYFKGDGTLYGMEPAEAMFGFTYHGNMIPPFKPEHTLMLGYGYGTIAELMRKVWGSGIKITGVDIARTDCSYTEYSLKICDALGFVKSCADGMIKKRFDYVAIDLFADGKTPSFVFWPEFASRVKEITKKMMAINVLSNDVKLMRPYYDFGFKFERHVIVGGNTVTFWSV